MTSEQLDQLIQKITNKEVIMAQDIIDSITKEVQ